MLRGSLGNWLQTPTGRRTAWDLGFLAVLFTFVGIAYGPCLQHPPRADQWCFLADTLDDFTFADTLSHSYSYNRTRRIAPGDTELFRPVLFALLSAEKALFAGDLTLWQGTGIVLHGVICTLFLRLLRRGANLVNPSSESDSAGPPWLQYATVSFFALNPGIQELVIWGHLHGYLVFLILLMTSLLCLMKAAEKRQQNESATIPVCMAWVLALIATFTYELGQFYSVLVGLLLAASSLKQSGWFRAGLRLMMFASIVILYQVANRIDMKVHEGQYQPDHLGPTILARAISWPTVSHSARFATYTTVQPFFPHMMQTGYSGQRLQVAESLWNARHVDYQSPASVFSIATLLFAAGLGFLGLVRCGRERLWLPYSCLLPAALYAGYLAITVLGRMNIRPSPSVISSNSYYTYTALLFALMTVSSFWHAVVYQGVLLRNILATVLAAFSVMGAEHVYRSNVNIARMERDWTLPLRAVQAFITQHKHEPNFSIEIDYTVSDKIPVVYEIPITKLVFEKWLAKSTPPRYRLRLQRGKAIVLNDGTPTNTPDD